jgi:hypothetical protein
MNANDGIDNAGVCALTFGNNIIEAVIENISKIAITIASVFCFAIFI